MSLANIQRTLAQIYVDSVLRKRFVEDPKSVGLEFGLSIEEISLLSEISSEQVKFFAESLQHKRLNEAAKLLPITYRLLGENFSKLFLDFADSFVPKGVKKHLEDAVFFSEYVSKTGRIEPPIVDIARYEAVRLTALNSNHRLIARLFRYPLKRIFRCVAEDNTVLSVKPYPTVAIWLRLSPKSIPRHFIF
jgi:hypothetical protein